MSHPNPLPPPLPSPRSNTSLAVTPPPPRGASQFSTAHDVPGISGGGTVRTCACSRLGRGFSRQPPVRFSGAHQTYQFSPGPADVAGVSASPPIGGCNSLCGGDHGQGLWFASQRVRRPAHVPANVSATLTAIIDL